MKRSGTRRRDLPRGSLRPCFVWSAIGVLACWAAVAVCAAASAPEAIVPVGATASSSQGGSKVLQNLFDGSGLSETAPGSGVWAHSSDAFRDKGVERGTMWSSGYPGGSADTTPTVTFDLGKAREVGSFRVWNYNESGWSDHGFKQVTVSISTDGETFTPVGTVVFAQAPGAAGYEGQVVSFPKVVNARHVRLLCRSTWKGSDNAGLSEIRFYAGGAGAADAISPEAEPVARRASATHRPNPPRPAVPGAENIVFPPDSGIIDVTAAPYHARGDGKTDDTRAIQAALRDYPNAGAIIYLPNGTYVISQTLTWPHGNRGGMEEKNTILQGQSRQGTVLRLQDNCPGFADPKQHRGMIWTGEKPAQRFRNAVRNLTFDTGRGNPGACGMHFMANNQGSVRNVTIRSGDGRGAVGLDLGYTDENGPCLIRNVRVVGFDVGIRTRHAVDSLTFEHITLENQNVVGFENDGQCVSLRGLTSVNAVPAVHNKAGSSFLVLVDARLTGRDAASGRAAIVNGGALLARGVQTAGYDRAIHDENGEAPAGGAVDEYTSHAPIRLFDSPARTLGLPVKETPTVPWDDLDDWVSPLQFGATGQRGEDITEALQKAIDAGKTTVYIPRGNYKITDTVLIRGKVRRLIGCEAQIDAADMDRPAFKVVDGDAPVVRFERMSGGYAKTTFVEHASKRTLVMSSCCNANCHLTGGGELFLEDICSNPFNGFVFQGGAVWARQFNVENEGTHVLNNGATLWVLGLKTERGGTLIETRGGGRTEVLGGFCYTTTAGKLAPMFVGDGGAMAVSLGESCFNGDPYATLVREVRGSLTRTLAKGQAPGRTGGSLLVLYTGYTRADLRK